MMNKWRVLIGVGICIFLGIWTVYENWPIVQSEVKIRREMLKKFTIGVEKSFVRDYVNQHYKKGPYDVFERNIGWKRNNNPNSTEIVGESRIRASISDIGIVDVTVIWLFDKDDKLIEIYSWKTIDFF